MSEPDVLTTVEWYRSARHLYRATGEGLYKHEILACADALMACQETGEAHLPFTGFFYRDETHRTIVHFNHQSRTGQGNSTVKQKKRGKVYGRVFITRRIR